jgi:hypothetical protein
MKPRPLVASKDRNRRSRESAPRPTVASKERDHRSRLYGVSGAKTRRDASGFAGRIE